MKLNLGCGNVLFRGWTNCDLYNPEAECKCDVAKLPFEDNSADEIYASHIIEHFHYYEAFDVLREWKRVLKPGGKITIETPDLLASCKAFVEADEKLRIGMYGHFFAQPWKPGETHKFLYTPTQLRWTLGQTGFRNIKQVIARRFTGCADDFNLGMEAYKGYTLSDGLLPLTQMLTFEIGQECTLAEVHKDKCPILRMNRTGSILTDDIVFNAVVDAYTNLGFTGFVGWSFYNEPMLQHQRILALMDRIRGAVPKSRFWLWTNGTVLVDDKRMEMFEQVFVTNYSGTPLDILKKHFGANVIVQPDPILDDRLIHYAETPTKKGCTLPFDNLIISNTGDAHICCLDWKNEIKLGNIFESSLSEIDRRRSDIVKKIAVNEMADGSPDACVRCKHKWNVCTFDARIQGMAQDELKRWEAGA